MELLTDVSEVFNCSTSHSVALRLSGVGSHVVPDVHLRLSMMCQITQGGKVTPSKDSEPTDTINIEDEYFRDMVIRHCILAVRQYVERRQLLDTIERRIDSQWDTVINNAILETRLLDLDKRETQYGTGKSIRTDHNKHREGDLPC